MLWKDDQKTLETSAGVTLLNEQNHKNNKTDFLKNSYNTVN